MRASTVVVVAAVNPPTPWVVPPSLLVALGAIALDQRPNGVE